MEAFRELSEAARQYVKILRIHSVNSAPKVFYVGCGGYARYSMQSIFILVEAFFARKR